MNEDERWSSYFYEGTNVLKNKLGITNYDELKKAEKNISVKKLIELYLNPINMDFNAKHLCEIHKFIFEDIYDFAGKYRYVNIGKTRTASFCNYTKIENSLNFLLNNIDNIILNRAKSDFLYAEALAEVYHHLISIHPFREGNGRTIREFIREYVNAKNYYFENYEYTLDFSKVDKEKFFEGTVNPSSSIGELKLEFMNALIKTPKSAKKIK